ncbi:MAG: hypothetical protein H6Q84_1558, partial [Deltaproteobacteria bacterium]|nr:hypothetical protein [Deltaproteobacteria bacterium]
MAKNRLHSNLSALLPILFVSLLIAGCGGGASGETAAGSAPVVVTMTESSVGLTTATLNGSVASGGLDTDAWFEWGTSPTLSSFDNTAITGVGAGAGNQAISAGLTGLTIGTAYYYRVAARNQMGTSRGTIESFVPSAVPSASTLTVGPLGSNTATLNGTVTPNGLATQAWFEWGTSSTLSTYDTTSSQDVGSGTSSQPVTAGLTGLAGGTTYYFRIAASNGAGTSRGDISSFVPGTAPTVATSAATSVGANTATLNGTVTPHGLATQAWFEWGTSSTLSTYDTTSSQDVGSGASSLPVTAGLTGLTGGTTYYFRIAASNGAGTSRGDISSFVPGAAPTVATSAATSVGANTATLNGTVTPNGLATQAWFEWGTSSTLSTYTSTSSQAAGSGTSGQAISAALTGLSSSTTYYFRIAASNSGGTRRGSIGSFTTTTAGAPVSTTLGTTALPAGAIINGTVDPEGLATAAWFEWGTDSNLSSYSSSTELSIGSGTAVKYMNEPLTELSIGTTYYYRVVGRNSLGTARGTIHSFTAADGNWTFSDDFITDTTGDYTIYQGGGATFTWNSGAKNAVARSGGGYLSIDQLVPGGATGTFSMKFTPTAQYGSGGNLRILI